MPGRWARRNAPRINATDSDARRQNGAARAEDGRSALARALLLDRHVLDRPERSPRPASRRVGVRRRSGDAGERALRPRVRVMTLGGSGAAVAGAAHHRRRSATTRPAEAAPPWPRCGSTPRRVPGDHLGGRPARLVAVDRLGLGLGGSPWRSAGRSSGVWRSGHGARAGPPRPSTSVTVSAAARRSVGGVSAAASAAASSSASRRLRLGHRGELGRRRLVRPRGVRPSPLPLPLPSPVAPASPGAPPPSTAATDGACRPPRRGSSSPPPPPFGATGMSWTIRPRPWQCAQFSLNASTQAGADPLARHLHQPERGHLGDLVTGAVAAQALDQAPQHEVAVGLEHHVDEVDDDDAADVAQPELAHDLLGGLEVVLGDRLLEVAARSR